MKKVLAILLIFSLLVSSIAISAFAVSGNIPEDVVAMSSQVAVEIEQEGIVLLKNDSKTLPLEGKKVNVFGAASVVPLLGGAGSGAITAHDPVYFYEALEEAGIEYNKALQALYEEECGGNEIPKTDNTILNNLLQLMLAKSSLE